MISQARIWSWGYKKAKIITRAIRYVSLYIGKNHKFVIPKVSTTKGGHCILCLEGWRSTFGCVMQWVIKLYRGMKSKLSGRASDYSTLRMSRRGFGEPGYTRSSALTSQPWRICVPHWDRGLYPSNPAKTQLAKKYESVMKYFVAWYKKDGK